MAAIHPDKDYFICAFCGARVPEGALACPECGSDEFTGWSDDIYAVKAPVSDDDDRTNDRDEQSWTKIIIAFIAMVAIIALLSTLIGGWALVGAPLLLMVLVWYYLTTIHKPGNISVKEDQLYTQLLRRARGDKALAERLIALERQYNPFRTRMDILLAVLEKWDRDSK